MSKRLAFMLAVALGGCAGGSGSARIEYASGVTVRSPELVTVDGYDDVYVVADADEPVFYADDYYWLYRNDRWYRSHSYDRDYVYVREPAPRVRRIHQPTAYVRYRSQRQEARNAPRPAPAPRDPWRSDYDRTDAPLQPTQPQQPATPYPRPPQQEPVTPSREIRVPERVEPSQVTPAQPPTRDVRPIPPGHDNRPATPPGQRDRVKPQPPAGGTNVTPPGPPANHDVRQDDRDRDRNDKAREEHPPKSPPGHQHDDDKQDKQDKKDKKDKKHDH